jgi:transposase
MMKLHDVLLKAMAKKLSWWEAAEIIGVTDRTMRRWRERLETEGYSGLVDRRKAKPSDKRVPVAKVEEVLRLYREEYFDLNMRHFHEKLKEKHAIELSYTFVQKALQGAGLVARGRKRRKHRRRRERRPLPGMLLFQDGSRHAWLEGQPELDLIVTMDDATSELYSMLFFAEEGTASSFLGLHETIARKGLFRAFYTDRGSHYFFTPKAGGKVDKTKLTQVGRALQQLGITHIPSYSPEARGRMERVFGTLQQRLPQELRLHKITTPAAANRYLRERFMPDHNARFAVPAAEPGSAFVPYLGRPLEDVLCVQEERQVGRDNCVQWNGRALQIPPQPHRHHYVKATLRVHEYPDGRLAIFDGPRCLARFDHKGKPGNASQAA